MKKHIILIISIIFSSCSTIKIQQQVVKDFIEEKKIKNTSSATPSFLIKEAASNEKTLEYYEMAFLDKDLGLGENRIEIVPSNSNYWPIDLKEINTLKSIQKKDSLPYYWGNEMIKLLGMPIVERKEFSLKTVKLIIPISASGHIISKPILSLDKKHAFFTYSIIYSSSSTPKKVFLVEKQKGKWKIKAYYVENYDYQPPSWRVKK